MGLDIGPSTIAIAGETQAKLRQRSCVITPRFGGYSVILTPNAARTIPIDDQGRAITGTHPKKADQILVHINTCCAVKPLIVRL